MSGNLTILLFIIYYNIIKINSTLAVGYYSYVSTTIGGRFLLLYFIYLFNIFIYYLFIIYIYIYIYIYFIRFKIYYKS